MRQLDTNLLNHCRTIRSNQYSPFFTDLNPQRQDWQAFKVNTNCLRLIPIPFLYRMFYISDSSKTGFSKLFSYVDNNRYQNDEIEAFNCFLDNESYYNQMFEYIKVPSNYRTDLSLENKDIIRGIKSIEEPVNNMIYASFPNLYGSRFTYYSYIYWLFRDVFTVFNSPKFNIIVGNGMVIDINTNSVLFCVTLQKEYLNYFGLFTNVGGNIDKEVFTFVFDEEFYNNPTKKYTKKLLTDLKDYVLSQHTEIDVELVDGIDFYNDTFLNTESFSGATTEKCGTSISEQLSFNTEIQYEMLEQNVLHNKLALNKITIV